MIKILVFSGGTLGHLMPIIPIIEKLKQEKNEIYLITTPNIEIDNALFKNIYKVNACSIKRNILKVIRINSQAIKKIKEILNEIKPNIVIGMGGYISGIGIYISTKLKYKTLIHEQNSIMGLANRLVYKKVNKIIYSNELLELKTNNKIYLPNPRSEVANIMSKRYLKKENQILIVSGSLGAKTLNDISIKLSSKLINYKIILITGKRYYEEYKKYQSDNLIIIPKTTNLIKYICESEIIISRAGATTISEILGANSLGIYIPSPNVTKNHQEKNTKIIKEKNLGLVILEKDLTLELLLKEIKNLQINKEYYYQNLKKIKYDNVIKSYIKIIKELDND